MTASARFGLLVSPTMLPMMNFGPRPYAQVLAGGVVVLGLVIGGILTWRRTGLRLAAASMVVAAVGMVLFTRVLIVWRGLSGAPPASLVGLGIALLLAAALMLAQSRTAPERWEQWRQHERTATLADILRCRHIPELSGAD